MTESECKLDERPKRPRLFVILSLFVYCLLFGMVKVGDLESGCVEAKRHGRQRARSLHTRASEHTLPELFGAGSFPTHRISQDPLFRSLPPSHTLQQMGRLCQNRGQ